MTCPQCKHEVPAKSLWTSSGLAAVTCPNCHVCLCPTPLCAIVLFVISFGLGEIALLLLRKMGASMWVTMAAFFAVFAVVFVATAPVLVRLRMKERRSQPRMTGRSA